LPPKCMTLNDLCARFKVIDSLNAANGEIQLSNDPTSLLPMIMISPKIINVLYG